VHGDVFRFPDNKELFCAVLGNGVQLLCMTVGVLGTAYTCSLVTVLA